MAVQKKTFSPTGLKEKKTFEQTDYIQYQLSKGVAGKTATPSRGGGFDSGKRGTSFFEFQEYQDEMNSIRDRISGLKAEKSRLEAGLSLDKVAPVQNEIDRLEKLVKYSDSKYGDNFFGQFGANYAQGRLSQDEALAWNAYKNNPTNETREYAEAASEALRMFQRNNRDALDEDATLPWVSRSLAGYLPQFADQTKAQIAGGLAGGAAASIVPVVGTSAGITGGAAAASGLYNYNVMGGSAFKALVDAGVDEEKARELASDEAFISSLIEAGDTIMDYATLGIGGLIKTAAKGGLSGIAKKGAEAAARTAGNKIRQFLEKKGVKLASGYLMNVAGEALEEGTQQIVSIANRERGLSGEGSGISNLFFESVSQGRDIFSGNNPEGYAEVMEAAAEGAKIAAMMGGATIAGTSLLNRALSGGRETSAETAETAQKAQDQSAVQEVMPGAETSQEAQTEQSRAVNDAIARMLEEQGLEGTAVQRQAAGVDMLINGGELGSNLANELRRSQAAQEVYRQMTGEELDLSGKPGEIRKRLKYLAAERMGQNAVGSETETTTMQAPSAPTVSVRQTEQVRPSAQEQELGSIASRVQSVNQVDRMAAGSRVLGPVGKEAASALYDGATDPDVYYQGYMQAYNAGMSNKRGQIPSVLTRQQYNDAFKAGRLDARSGNRGGGLVQSSAASRLSDAGTIDALARKLGVSVVAEETISGPDGRRSAANGYIKDGVIHIALDADDPAMVVFKHEVTHMLQERGAKEYAAFRDYAVQTMGEAEVDRIQSLYRDNGVELSRDGAMDEVAANFTERLLTDEKAVRLLIRDDRNIAQKIFDAIRDMARKLTGKEGAKLREAEKMWARMFEETAGQRTSERGKMETRYSEKEDAGHDRTREETREEFERRCLEEGYQFLEGAGVGYGFRRAGQPDDGRTGEQASRGTQTQHEMKALGISADVIDGPILRNRNGFTDMKAVKQSVTVGRSHIFISKDATLPPRNIAGHEAFHLWKNGKGRETYIETVEDNLDFTSEAFRSYQSDIAQTVLGQEADLTDPVQADKLLEELLAYISGDIHEGTNDAALRPMFRDYGAVKSAWESLVLENGGTIDRDSSGSARFSLRQENERLRELNQYLREEVSDPSVVRTNRNAVKKLAGTMLRDYDSAMDRAELTDRLMGLYDYIANGKDAGGNDLTWTEVNRQANDIAQDILSSAVAQGNPLYEEYADVRSYAKRQAVVVPQSSRGDFDQFGGWGEFRKRNAGRLKLMNDGLPSDVFYQELSSQWPELFPDDIINPADQMIHTAEMLQYLDAVYENPYSMELDVYRRYLSDQILEEFYEVPERRTFAQRQQQKQTRQAIRYEKRISDLRQRQKDRVADLRRQGRERVKEAITAQRTESQKKLEALKKKYQSKDAATRERREAAATRAKIERHVKKLSQLLLRPSDKSHVPESLKKPVADLLASINLESQFTIDPETGKRVKGGTGDPVKRTQAFQELRTAYADIAKDGEYLIDPDLQDNLDAVIKLKDKRLSEMTQAELEKVWRSVRAMEASIQSANKLLAKSKFESVAALADNIRVENSEKREKKNYVSGIGFVDGLLNLDMLTPETFFHRLGDGGDALFRMMRNAADEQTRILKEAEDYTKSLLDGMDARKLEKEIRTVRVGGRDIEMSTAQIMELYVLSRRKQAMDHLYVGGIRTTGAQKGLVETGFVEPVHVTPDEVGRIVSTLTPEQIRVADGMQKFLSEEMAEKGNRTSMRVYGYKKFNEKFYWPIRVDSNQTITDVTKEGAEKMVPQYGMTKQITPKANNALFIGSIFDSYAKHITEMSIYSAWLATWEDVNRVHNFQFRNQEGQRTGTVKTVVQKVFGKNGNAYITNLLKDVSQGTKSNADTIFSVRGLTSAYKAAAVGANLRVILQQPTAALRALDVIDPKYFLEGMSRKGDWEKVKKWSPIAQWKDWGYFEMDTGRAIKDVILGTDSLLEKTKQGAMWAAGKADSLTWSRIWNACEAEISDKRPGLKKGSDEFYKAVADRFNQVIDQTQVVDSVLHRTQIMRSSGELHKMAASFMSEPSKVYNMLLRSIYDMRSAIRPEARVAARKKVGRTAFALVASFAVNAIAQSLVDGLRDDDRDKKYWEKFAKAYQENFVVSLTPFGYIPYVKDIVSLFQGYDVQRMDMASIAKTIESATNAYKALTGDSKKTVKSAFADLFFEASRLFGVPVANVKRDVMAAVMTAAIETDNYLL